MDDHARDVAEMHRWVLDGIREQLDEGREDFTIRVECSYLVGAYLAVNAIADARLVLEGPDCTYMKSQFVQGNHDLMSTLMSVSGYHRVVTSDIHVDGLHASRETGLRAKLHGVASHPSTRGLFVSSMPMAMITGADYDRLCREVREDTGTQVIAVRGLSLQGDWLDGYAEVLKCLARRLELPEVERDPNKVAVLGYLMDRNEWDHRANLRELRSIFEALGLELCSVWLSGQGFDELGRVAEAGTLVQLPYAGRAGKFLARRTGADLLKLDLPFGLEATERFVRALGAHFDRREAAEAYIEARLASIVPRLEVAVPLSFQNARFGWVGDPILLNGFDEMVRLLGGTLPFAVVTNRPTAERHLAPGLKERTEILSYPRLRAFNAFVTRHLSERKIHLLVTNTHGFNVLDDRAAFMEFGFPCIYDHALYDRPFLGFGGFACFVDRMMNTLQSKEAEGARQKGLRLMVARMKAARGRDAPATAAE